MLPGTNHIAQLRLSVYKPHTTHNSSIRSDEWLTLETSAFESLYGGQFTLSTQLKSQIRNFLVRTGKTVASKVYCVSQRLEKIFHVIRNGS